MHRSSRSCSIKHEKADRTLPAVSWAASSRQAPLQGFSQHSMASRVIWLHCPLCTALLCGCLSCTFVSLHVQHLLHRQTDWMAPCSSDLLSCLGMSNRIWHDKMLLQKTLHKAQKLPQCSPGLHSQALALSVLKEISPVSLELHHTSRARAQTDQTPELPEEPLQLYPTQQWKFQVLFQIILPICLGLFCFCFYLVICYSPLYWS